MQLVVLCGGMGTRLREEMEHIPKPLVKVGERPILWHILKHYAHYGIKDYVLALGYKGEAIRHYFIFYEAMNRDVTFQLANREELTFHNEHDEGDWRISLVNTGLKTLKGARLKRVEPFVTGDSFLMTYGDGVANVDVEKLIAFHRSHGKIATVTGVNPFARFGELKTDGDKVLEFSEKSGKFDDYVNGGYFVFNRQIFDYLSDDESCDLEYGPLEKVTREGQMKVYKHDGFWACMDTQRDRDYLNELWRKDQAPWKLW